MTVQIFFLTVFLSVSAVAACGWRGAKLWADEQPGASSAGLGEDEKGKKEADEKAAAAEQNDAKAALQEKLRKAPLPEAIAALEEAIAQFPDDKQYPQMRHGLVPRLLSSRDVPGAIEQIEKLMAFQLSEAAEADADQNARLAFSALTLRSLYLREKKPEQAAAVAQKALDALRAAAEKSSEDSYLMPISQLVSAVAAGLTTEEKFSAAEELLQLECLAVQQRVIDAPSELRPLQAWANLMQSRVSNATRSEPEQAKVLAAELDAGILAAVEKNTKSPEMLSELIRVRTAEISRLYRDEPAVAQELLNQTMESVEGSELKDDKLISAAVTRLKALESRIASAMHILEMIGKPAPALDIEASAHGEAVVPEQLKGKVVLLDFWAVWCGPCIATFPHLKEWHEEFHDQGLEIVGVTRQYGYEWNEEAGRVAKANGEVALEDEQKMLDKFMSFHELHHATIITPKMSEMQKQFGVTGIPHAVLIDRQGNVRMVKVGSGPTNASALHEMIGHLIAE